MPLSDCLIAEGESRSPIPVHLVTAEAAGALLDGLDPAQRTFARASGFEGTAGQLCLLPGAGGAVASVLFGIGKPDGQPFALARLGPQLPPGDYAFATLPAQAGEVLLALALQRYAFTRYKPPTTAKPAPRFVAPASVDLGSVKRIADAVAFGRDLINTPANDLGPAELAEAALDTARGLGAETEVIVGDDLLARGFPLIHAVGAGSVRQPRLVDITWGDPTHPKVTIVGKGVVFDTGGLDIKPSANMLLMKKDMGGAAAALVAARLVMEAGLSVRLRVLIPIVENAVSGRAMRPSDVVRSRKGLSVEINNTDAEGRLILADALSLADEDAPELIVDFATLTGAARVALGPDLPALFTRDDALAADLGAMGAAVQDPTWRLPLWSGYAGMLDSKVADLSNVSSGAFAGAITAALFLERFVERAKSWAHVDLYAWNATSKPGRPEGGDIQVARALYALMARRWPPQA